MHCPGEWWSHWSSPGRSSTRLNHAAAGNAGGINRNTWTWLGPGNIGGRIRAVAIHPTNSSVLFAGSVGGGIWKTTNGGALWSPVDDFMANLAVSTIVFQPDTPSTLYAGTGEGFSNADRIQGAGIFKSTSSGAAWTMALQGSVFTDITDVVVDARSSVFGAFNQSRFADITVTSRPAMALDQPAASGASVTAGQAFMVAGWAVDRAAGSGSGVDTVHIYAFQSTGGAFGAGAFLGAVSATNARPDVGAVFGSQFTASGFHTQVTLAAPGIYRLVAYARSSVSGTFNQEKAADITVK